MRPEAMGVASIRPHLGNFNSAVVPPVALAGSPAPDVLPLTRYAGSLPPAPASALETMDGYFAYLRQNNALVTQRDDHPPRAASLTDVRRGRPIADPSHHATPQPPSITSGFIETAHLRWPAAVVARASVVVDKPPIIPGVAASEKSAPAMPEEKAAGRHRATAETTKRRQGQAVGSAALAAASKEDVTSHRNVAELRRHKLLSRLGALTLTASATAAAYYSNWLPQPITNAVDAAINYFSHQIN